MKLTLVEVKQVFLNVIEKKITFEDAANWASEIMRLDEIESLECDDKDLSKIFDGLTYLSGVDIVYTPGFYLHSLQDVENKYKDFFINDLTTYEKIEKVLIDEWNPLKLNETCEAMRKYSSYISRVYELLLFQKNKSEITDYLLWAETEEMKLTGNREKTEKITQKLLNVSHDYFH